MIEHISNIRHSILISTYVSSKSHENSIKRLPETIKTLISSGYPGDIWIVDDGSDNINHLDNLKWLSLLNRVRIIYHKHRYGISSVKNTCLQIIRDHHYDFSFLSDDDNQFNTGWWDEYIRAYLYTGIEHFSWSFPDLTRRNMTSLGYSKIYSNIDRIEKTAGILLTVTQNIIKKVGGFKILPAYWGYEHLDWTDRIVKSNIVPFICDIVDSYKYVCPNKYSEYSPVVLEERNHGASSNPSAANKNKNLYIPIQPGCIKYENNF